MKMSVLWIVGGMLAILPFFIAIYFLAVTLPRRLVAVKQDRENLVGGNPPPSSTRPVCPTMEPSSFTHAFSVMVSTSGIRAGVPRHACAGT